jgi:hypothetical protein
MHIKMEGEKLVDKLLAHVLQYMQGNAAGAIAAGVILLFVLIKKPKLFFVLVIISIAAAGAMNLFDTVASVGTLDKDFRSLSDMK